MARRVFELARELGVTSKVILEKCRAEGLDIKNHMSALSAGLEATIAEWFSEAEAAAASTAVERAAHVDLTKARAEAKKRRRKRAEEAKKGVPPAAEAEEAEVAAATAVAEAPAAEPEAAQVAEWEVAAVAEAPPQVEEVVAAEAERLEKTPKAKPEEPQELVIKPAGPQVVPKPAALKGPRVVRVERPDFVPAPPGARGAGIIQPPRPIGVGARAPLKPEVQEGAKEEPSRGRKKAKRRSPRRRGGRSAESGEKLREWRDQDLQERSARLAAAGIGLRRHRPTVSRKRLAAGPGIKAGTVEVQEPITVKSLSAATGIKAADLIKKLLHLGTPVTINQSLDRELAEAAVLDYNVELAVKAAKTAEDELVKRLASRPKGELAPRASVATFLGHVDHGKTSLLDRIRNTAVAEGEAGGITQHMGAYRYDKDDVHVVFLDTPGHEAFTHMRARGANMTDVVVLVVAADDGVMPQTVEAISHARAAGVPIVVALNKIDVPNRNEQRALGQLAEQGLQPREWGGDIEVIRTSAVTGEGIPELVETLSLEAELLELIAERDAPASGFVIEAELDPGRGGLARVLVRNGTLKVGDIVLAGGSFGRVRQMLDDRGRSIQQAPASTPVEIAGLGQLPEAGDRFYVVQSLEQAREVAMDRRVQTRRRELAFAPARSLEELLVKIQAGEANELALIVKGDAQGTVEALVDSLSKLGTDEVRLNILHAGAGGISTGDVSLAEASDAIIIGFNIVPDAAARQMAEASGVDVRLYHVIYEVIEDVRRALEEGLAPEIREESMGRAEVRQVFKVSRVGTVAGCFVTDGAVQRNARVRIIRDNIVIEDDRALEGLRRFKDDVRDVRAGLECGVKIAGYDDIKEGDVLEFYQQIEVARTL